MNARATNTEHHRIAIVGGGSAGISVAARLSRALKQATVLPVETKSSHIRRQKMGMVMQCSSCRRVRVIRMLLPG